MVIEKYDRWLAGGRDNKLLEPLFFDADFFLYALWKDRGLDKVAPLSPVEMSLWRFAIGVDPAAGRRRGVLAFRGIGKTHIVTGGGSCYRYFRDPNRKIIIPSKSVDAAKKTVRLIREWFNVVWFLQHLRPGDEQRDAATYFDVGPAKEDRQPSMTAIGIDGQLENNRAHTIFPDDVETKKNTLTLEGRIELERMCSEFTNILYPDRKKEDGGPLDPTEIIYVGTPKHEETLYKKQANKGYTFRSFPLVFPGPSDEIINLAPIIQDKLDRGEAKPGDPTCPHRFGRTEIIERMGEGLHEFSREQQLVINLNDATLYPLRLSDLIVMDVAPDAAPISVQWGTRDHNGGTGVEGLPCLGLGEDRLYRPCMISQQWAPYVKNVMAIDPAGRGSDKTGIAIGGWLAGTIHVKAVLGLSGGYQPEDLATIANLARDYRVTDIVIEHNFGGGMFDELLRPVLARHFWRPGENPDRPEGWHCGIVDDTKLSVAHARKEERIIEALGMVTQQHRLVIDRKSLIVQPGEELKDSLQYQITRIQRQPKCLPEYGKIDALALLVAAFKHLMAVDPDKASKRLEDDHLEKELAKRLGLCSIKALRPKPRVKPRMW